MLWEGILERRALGKVINKRESWTRYMLRKILGKVYVKENTGQVVRAMKVDGF